MHRITLQQVSKTKPIPSKNQFTSWVEQVLPMSKKNHEVVIRIVDLQEITELNNKYRKKNKPTNIISFQADLPPGITVNLLGDLVICAPLVIQEAKLQRQPLIAHWAHLTIHGILHLLGHNHQKEKAAKKMESLEVKHLRKLGFANPYQ